MSKSSGKGPGRAIPAELRDLDRWVAWELRRDEATGKERKVPVHPKTGHAFSTRTGRPTDFETAAAARDGQVGLVLTGGVGGRIAIDIDACRDPETGALMPWAKEVVDFYGRGYTEITPSGTGLRVWLQVDELPERELRKVRGFEAAPNTTKTPEIEFFGLGRPCYVTLTGKLLPGCSSEIPHVRSLEWLLRKFPMSEAEDLSELDLPTAPAGEVPSLDELDRAVHAMPHGADLTAGHWEEVVPDESASEGYYRLAQMALRAANGDGYRAVEWLLERTSYGQGYVDSAEPDRYGREGWVAREVARIAEKAPRPSAAVFDDDFTASSYMPTEDVPQAPRKRRTGKVLQLEDYARSIASRTWLAHGLFPSHGLAELYGDPGSGKSAVAYNLGVKCALGLAGWCGFELDETGPVVVFVGEDDAGVRDRLIAQLAELDPLAALGDVPIYCTTEPGNLTDPEDVGSWVEATLEATGGDTPRLVIVDTLSRNFGDGSENDSEDMRRFIAGCQRLERGLGKALVLCVHHSGHGAKERSRGSSAWRGACDTAVRCTRQGTRITLEAHAPAGKVKGAAEPRPWTGELEPMSLGRDEKGRPKTAVTFSDEPRDPTAAFDDAEVDDELLEFLVGIRGLAGRRVSQTEIGDELGLSRDKVRTRLGRVMALGLVVKSGGPAGNAKGSYELTREAGVLVEERNRDVPPLGI